jgi:5'-phosphate synthase pdxT subunit
VKTIGVLALQGAFAKHIEKIEKLGQRAIEIRLASQLNICDGLIIPGGESTTLNRLLAHDNLREALVDFSQKKPIFGTCAGLILMAKTIKSSAPAPTSTLAPAFTSTLTSASVPAFANISDASPQSLNLLEIEIERNAYGRQINSFKTMVKVESMTSDVKQEISAIFIRAPRIMGCAPSVQILAKIGDNPVLVQQQRYLGCTFHPELTLDTVVHEHFLSMIA